MLELSRTDKMRRVSFLGREFLTWLMFHSARDDGIFRVNNEVAEVFFDKAIQMQGDSGARDSIAVKAAAPQDTSEVAAALRNGKAITRATLLIVADGREFGLTIDSALTFKSVKLPKSETVDYEDLLAEESDNRAQLESVVHGLFVAFLNIRRDPELWAVESDEIRDWIDGLGAETDISALHESRAVDSTPVALESFLGSKETLTEAKAGKVCGCDSDCTGGCGECASESTGAESEPPVTVLAKDATIGKQYTTPAGHVVRVSRVFPDFAMVLLGDRELRVPGSQPLTVFAG